MMDFPPWLFFVAGILLLLPMCAYLNCYIEGRARIVTENGKNTDNGHFERFY